MSAVVSAGTAATARHSTRGALRAQLPVRHPQAPGALGALHCEVPVCLRCLLANIGQKLCLYRTPVRPGCPLPALPSLQGVCNLVTLLNVVGCICLLRAHAGKQALGEKYTDGRLSTFVPNSQSH